MFQVRSNTSPTDLNDATFSRRVLLGKALVKGAEIAVFSNILLALNGCEKKKAASGSPPTVKDIIGQDLQQLIAREYKSLDTSEVKGMLRPGGQQVIGNSFDNMMSHAPEMDPYSSKFHEGEALYFVECLAKLFMVSTTQASPQAQKLLNLPEAKPGDASAEDMHKLRDRISNFKPLNRHDTFVKKFMYAYLDNYYNFSVILEDLQNLFSQKSNLPSAAALATKLRTHANNLRRMIYKPAVGEMDIAIRKATWRAVDKVALQAEAISR